MAQQRIGIIMNGVTGRMGTNQHLIRSILAIVSWGTPDFAASCRCVSPALLRAKRTIRPAIDIDMTS